MSSEAPTGRPSRKPPESAFLRSLWRPLRDEADREIDLAMKVALLLHHEIPQAEIAERLKVPLSEVKAAVKRLRKVGDRIDRDAAPGQEHD